MVAIHSVFEIKWAAGAVVHTVAGREEQGGRRPQPAESAAEVSSAQPSGHHALSRSPEMNLLFP